MSLRNTVKSNVNLAFKLIGDLAVDVIFTPRVVNSFDFAVKSEIEIPSVPATLNIKAVVIVAKKKSKTKEVTQTQLLFKKEDMPEQVTGYDTVTIDGKIWKVGKPLEDDGYTVTIEVFGEG